jgi:hypothetical protein
MVKVGRFAAQNPIEGTSLASDLKLSGESRFKGERMLQRHVLIYYVLPHGGIADLCLIASLLSLRLTVLNASVVSFRVDIPLLGLVARCPLTPALVGLTLCSLGKGVSAVAHFNRACSIR